MTTEGEDDGFETRGERRREEEVFTDADEVAEHAPTEAAPRLTLRKGRRPNFDVVEETRELAEDADELAEQAHKLADHVDTSTGGDGDDADEEGFPTERES